MKKFTTHRRKVAEVIDAGRSTGLLHIEGNSPEEIHASLLRELGKVVKQENGESHLLKGNHIDNKKKNILG